MTNCLRSILSLFILTAFFLLSPMAAFASSEAAALAASDGLADYQGSAIIFVTGDGSRKNVMLYEPGAESPVVLAGQKGVMETQPTLGPKGETAWVRRNGQNWDLLRNGQVVSSGELHLSPAFRPDGALVAAISGEKDTSIYIFSGKTPSLLVQGKGLAVSPSFSPDGRKLAYVSNESGDGQIYVANSDGSNPRLLTPSTVRNTDPTWSPDGSLIVFVTNETDISIVNPDGSGLRRLTKNQGVNRHPSFSPDGRKIVFSSDRDGLSKLYVMNADGSGQKVLLPSLKESQHAPHWGPVAP
ncbi:hypothetical protein C4J81_09810 [Deltaproteobacteria bacterium Smac51]|nr:hypothetical protein C4J81_09810 [Deltaproteobacteria bacterium Smac51]